MISMTKIKNYNEIMESINKARKYKLPENDSVIAETFLKSIPENVDNNDKCIIDNGYLLTSLAKFKYIKKCKNGGYEPQKEYVENGLFEVKECFIITTSIKNSYTLLFTLKGQEFFKEFVLKLIDLKTLQQ